MRRLLPMLALMASVAITSDPCAQDDPPESAKAESKKLPSLLDFQVPAEPAPGKTRWNNDYFEAIEEARRRNCVLLAILSNDQSTGFHTSWNKLLSTPEFAEIAERCVIIPAIGGTDHRAEEREVDGKTIRWCGMFKMDCRHHCAMHDRLKPQFDKVAFQNPLQLYLDPDGVAIGRLEGHIVDLLAMKEKLEELAPKIEGKTTPYTVYREHMLALREALDLREKKGTSRVIKTIEGLQKDVFVTEGMIDYSDRIVREMLREGRLQLDEARKLADTDLKEAKKIVSRVQREYRDTPVGDAARELSKELKKR